MDSFKHSLKPVGRRNELYQQSMQRVLFSNQKETLRFFPPTHVKEAFGVFYFTLVKKRALFLCLSRGDFSVLCAEEEDREGSMSFGKLSWCTRHSHHAFGVV